jgi:hypothetical protein
MGITLLARVAEQLTACSGRALQKLTCLFSNDFARILVLPDSEKDWMPKTIISRPFRVFYLADHHRLDPTATSHFGSSQTLIPTTPAECRNIEKGQVSIRIFCSSE